jgi:CRISPR-associated endonuclease/helicase Cas3
MIQAYPIRSDKHVVRFLAFPLSGKLRANKRKHFMKNLKVTLGPVYSRLADKDDTQGLDMARLPDQLQLRRHQARTWQAYRKGEIEVIFDTALTSDGKSLAGQLPMYMDDAKTLLLYPTNELIRDQLQQVERYMRAFGMSYPYQTLYSEQITEEIETVSPTASRSSVIQTWLKNNHYILSNPDLFHLLSSYNYGRPGDQREHVYLIPQEFDSIIFDEFHIFGPPQIVWIINIMNYHKIANPHRRIRYIFLSATPTRLFKSLLENSGFTVQEIEGEYSSVPAIGYTPQPIVQPVTLHLHSLSDKGAYAWAEQRLDDIVEFYHAHPTSKGVFIVNSVAMAKRLVAYYKRELQDKHNIRIGENTRLTNKADRLAAMKDADLIIATSTIDVGVDFKINLLIFESSGVGTFIQRLGRLGRHPGWQEYRAYALLPDWTVERFSEHFEHDSQIERVAFLNIIREHEEYSVVKDGVTTVRPIFQPDQEYKRYTSCWGGVQAAHMLVQTADVGKQYQKSDFYRQLYQQYTTVYKHSKNQDWIGSQIKRYHAIKESKYDSKVIAELNAFRGRSPLDCGIFDKTDQSFKTYSLFFLLANTRFSPITEAQFKKMLEERQQKFAPYRSHDLQLYVILEEYIEEREQFSLSCSLSFKGKLNQIHVYDTFSIQDSRALAAHLDNSVNDRLLELELVCLVSPEKPRDLKRSLPPLFPVYSVKDKDNLDRSVVVGLDAFLAHSLVSWKPVKDDDDELFIC